MPRRYAFTRRQRLRKGAEFEAVFKTRQTLRSLSFLVMSCPNELGYARLGMVVGKRQLKFASARNRVRRIIRETFRLYSPTLPALDVVVRVGVAPAEGTEAAQLATLLAKLK